MNENRLENHSKEFWCQQEIAELAKSIKQLPSSFAIPLMQKIGDVVLQARIHHVMAESTQKAFADLKWEMTCVKFDLEMTRKERDDYFKRLLD